MKTARQKNAVKILTAIISMILITVTSILSYINLSPIRNPEILLKKYINAVYNEDWETVYKNITIKRSPLVTKEKFLQYCSEIRFTQAAITDFETEKIKEENDLGYYSINYIADDNSTGTFYLTVKEINKGIYAVCPTKECFGTLSVYAACTTKITLNDTVLSSTNITETDPITNNQYTISKFTVENLLPGTYSLTAVNEYFEELTTEIVIDDDCNDTELYLEQTLNENSFNKLCSDSKDVISNIYNGVIHDNLNKESLPLSTSFSSEDYDSFISSVSDDLYKDNSNYNITEFEITDCKPKSGYKNMSFNCKSEEAIDITFAIDYNYTAKSPDYLGEQYTAKKSDTGYFYIQYILENGTWKISNLSQQIWV
ncbi:MAG: hypothetical protein K2G22_05375 [Eubacterium sp.]|nr:hypothetical protein [Eubacterium sp.]